ncbi:MAG: hypothetical protein Q9206_004435 [Seirophora lacunosa]
MAESRKTVLITGCSPGGIGNALAREFHSKGLQVIATARTAEVIQDLADIGIVTFSLDVTSEKGIDACKEEVMERTGGGLDYLVNNAGRNYTVPAIEAEMSEVEAVYATNLFAVIRLCQTFMPLLRRSRGTIVQIGSVAGCVPYAFGSVYNASKAALHSYSGALRVEVAPLGVHVITVVTGGVKSRISRVNRCLAEDSAYRKMDADYRARQVHSQTVGMETRLYAQVVVKQVLEAEGWLWRTRTIWAGGAAGTVKWLSWILPEAGMDWVVSRIALLYTTTRHNVFDMDEAMSEKAAEIFSAEKEVKAEKVEMWKNMTEDAQPQPAISPVPDAWSAVWGVSGDAEYVGVHDGCPQRKLEKLTMELDDCELNFAVGILAFRQLFDRRVNS